MNTFHRFAILPVSVALLWGTAVMAAPLPEASLNTCQDKVRTEGKKAVQNTINAVGTCLKAVAGDVIKNSGSITASTSAKCVTQFRKINDTRVPPADKSIEQKLRDAVDKKCVPAFTPSVTHVIDDVTAHGAGSVTEKIKSVNIDTWCKHFSGDGSIDTVTEWEDCMVGSFNCEAAAAIATQFPRAAEWLTALTAPGTNMNLVVPPATDPTRTTDAVAGAILFEGLIDPDGDGIPNVSCGGEGVACGTACCYVENVAIPPPGDVTCFEYTAPAAQFGAFMGMCPGPSLVGSMIKTPIAGPCGAAPSPIWGALCAGPPALVKIPTDSSCP